MSEHAQYAAPSGIEIARWFTDAHGRDWHQKQGCDGFTVARSGNDYCYIWVYAYVDHDLQVFYLLDVRTAAGEGPFAETRDFLYVTEGVDGFECEWHQRPIKFSAPTEQHVERGYEGLRWLTGRIDDHVGARLQRIDGPVVGRDDG